MYADDALGESREDASDPLPHGYLDAFAEIDGDPRHRLVVAVEGDEPVGTLQPSFLPHLVLRGTRRAQVEAVRSVPIAVEGVWVKRCSSGRKQARDDGCRMVQLTTNSDRADARHFYANLGFEATHVGMKMVLSDS